MPGSSLVPPLLGRVVQTVLTVAAAVAFIGAVALIAGHPARARRDGPGASAAAARAPTTDVNPEAAEQAEIAEERAEAFEEAEAQGKVGQARPTARPPPLRPPAGPASSRSTPVADDWEPAIAADPNAPYVYTLVTRYARQAVPRQLPVAVHGARDQRRRRRDLERGQAALRLQGLGPVRPDHRGRPDGTRRRLRART